MKCWSWVALLVLAAAAPCAWAAISYSTVILGDAPIGYWRLGESSSAVTAVEATGSGRDGIYTRGVINGVPGAINGDPDTAAQFDENTAWVNVPVIPSDPFTLKNSFTLEAWVINNGQGLNARSPVGRIFSNGWPGNSGFGWGILPGNNMRFTTYGIKDYDSSLTVVPQDGAWHYVAVVFDFTNTANFYLDGVLTDSIPGPSPARTTVFDLNIGRNPTSTAEEFFNGSIDEAAIYASELSDATIATHYMIGIQ